MNADAEFFVQPQSNVVSMRRTAPAPRVYCGQRKLSGCVVTVKTGLHEVGLDPRYDLAMHSPTGFEWGYGGSGPAQLALALLADATSDDARAVALYQRFKEVYVAPLVRNAPWSISDADVRKLVEAIEHAVAASAGGG